MEGLQSMNNTPKNSLEYTSYSALQKEMEEELLLINFLEEGPKI